MSAVIKVQFIISWHRKLFSHYKGERLHFQTHPSFSTATRCTSSAFSDTLVHIGPGIGSTLNLCTVQLATFAEVTRAAWTDICSIPFVLICLWLEQPHGVMKRSFIRVVFFSLQCLLLRLYWPLTWQLCLPALQLRPDDGFIELGDLPLQHRPQAFSEAVVVLLQLLLVLFLVRCDQVLVLLNRLTTPTAQRVGNYYTVKMTFHKMGGRGGWVYLLTFLMQ